MAQRQTERETPVSTGKKPHADADTTLFREAMKQVRPLRLDENRFIPPRDPPPPHPRQKKMDEQRVLEEMMTAPVDFTEVETGDELLFLRDGIQRGVLRKLRRGQFSRRLELDLHGMTVPVAQQAIGQFLRLCQAEGITCARIIHGKGQGSKGQKPVLKNRVNHWLRQREEVLAFCSARPEDGGTGALYVLLKTKR